jgi:hypothetical protein
VVVPGRQRRLQVSPTLLLAATLLLSVAHTQPRTSASQGLSKAALALPTNSLVQLGCLSPLGTQANPTLPVRKPVSDR